MAERRLHFVIDPAGRVEFIHSDEAMALAAGLGAAPSVTRASHVEPVPGTATWEADLAPCGGPVLGPFATKGEALAAEEAWLLEHRLRPGAQPGG